MHDHTKHLSFPFDIQPKYFSPAVKIIKPPEINVRYTLDYKGEVALDDYNMNPGIAQHIVNWTGLEEEMLVRAKKDARKFPIRIEYEILRGSREAI